MAISRSGLGHRQHVSCLESLRPHETPFVVLNAHNPLSTNAAGSGFSQQATVYQLRDLDVHGGRRRALEAEHAIPGHVLDGKECAVSGYLHVVVTITN